MEFNLTGHDFLYELNQAANLFFRQDEEVYIKSTLDFGDTKDTFKTEICMGENSEEFELDLKKPYSLLEAKNAVKKSFYLAAKKLMPERQTPWGIMTGIRPCKLTRDLIHAHGTEKADMLLRDEYLVSDKKRKLIKNVCEIQKPMLKSNKPRDISLYIGIPFCPTRCLYCSFICESAQRYLPLTGDYTNAVIKELCMLFDIIDRFKLNLTTIYVGGGTPTTLSEDSLKKLMDAINMHTDVKKTLEFTVEAGRPDTININKLKILKAAGVTRLCINPQTMNDKTLKLIGRSHSAKDIENAFMLAREAGFTNINSDLICGLPKETEDDFLYTLSQIDKLSPEAITVHTMYLKRASKLYRELDEYTFCDTTEKMIDCISSYANKNGYAPYYLYRQRATLGNLENIGYAKNSAFSYYNVFMMEEVQTILGAGSGASTKIVSKAGISRIYNNKDPKWYIDSLDEMLIKKQRQLTQFFMEG